MDIFYLWNIVTWSCLDIWFFPKQQSRVVFVKDLEVYYQRKRLKKRVEQWNAHIFVLPEFHLLHTSYSMFTDLWNELFVCVCVCVFYWNSSFTHNGGVVKPWYVPPLWCHHTCGWYNSELRAALSSCKFKVPTQWNFFCNNCNKMSLFINQQIEADVDLKRASCCCMDSWQLLLTIESELCDESRSKDCCWTVESYVRRLLTGVGTLWWRKWSFQEIHKLKIFTVLSKITIY